MNSIKIYKPGSPEFESVAAQVIPLRNIRSGLSHTTTYIDADRDTSKASVKRRGESVDKLR
jgi:hypothetical protein